jgi:hypothetical protein
MTLLGKTIQLKGLSQKGKNRVRDHNNQWIVLAETDKVLFNPQHGPWLFVSPVGCDQNHKASRWLRAIGDPDFLIE